MGELDESAPDRGAPVTDPGQAPAAPPSPAAAPPLRPIPRLPRWRVRLAAALAVLGPGLVSGFADNDAGGITTYSLAGTNFGYTLLWVILASQIVLFFTQEVGARLGLATGKGLMGLIRERWGVRWTVFAALLMLAANLGSIVAEFAGIGSALGIFGIPPQISAAVAAVVVVAFIALGSYSRVQYLFVGGRRRGVRRVRLLGHRRRSRTGRSRPRSMLGPQLTSSPAYWLAVVGTVGTTITPWGQAFIQSYVADKGLRPEDLRGQPRGRVRRRAAHQRDRGLHPHRLRGDAHTRGPPDHLGRRRRPGAGADRGRGGGRDLRRRPARRLVPGPRRGAPVLRLHHVRGVRLGDGRRLELARRARRSTACWRSSSGSRRCSS